MAKFILIKYRCKRSKFTLIFMLLKVKSRIGMIKLTSIKKKKLLFKIELESKLYNTTLLTIAIRIKRGLIHLRIL